MFQGFIDLEGTFKGLTISEPASKVPTAADSLPTARVYSASGYLLNATVTTFDTGNLTGAYQWSVAATAANGFASGQSYFVVFNYTVASVNFSKVESFAVS